VQSSPSPYRARGRIILGTPDDDEVEPQEDFHTGSPKQVAQTMSTSAVESKRNSPAPPPKQAVQSTLRGFFAPAPNKRPLAERSTIPPITPAARPWTPRSVSTVKTESKSSMTQMHLTHLPLLHSCKECSMSYVRGGEDEALHAKHHVKVIRGMPWDGLGKGKGKQTGPDIGWKVVTDHVEFGSGREKGKGRVVMCDGSWGGHKVSPASKVTTDRQLAEILSTVDTVLSSPALDPPMLERCRIFLFVTSSPPPTSKKARPLPGGKQRPNVDRIVSVVVAQPIKVAMRVLRDGEPSTGCVDSGSGIMCE